MCYLVIPSERKRGPRQAPFLRSAGCWSESRDLLLVPFLKGLRFLLPAFSEGVPIWRFRFSRFDVSLAHPITVDTVQSFPYYPSYLLHKLPIDRKVRPAQKFINLLHRIP